MYLSYNYFNFYTKLDMLFKILTKIINKCLD